ncbi:hypothetical protein SAMN05421805_10160 [Saccharopolyspora antimicrobica]|uniref:Uncharacterized protein n=1 Tax=Saccharopolyspora antimicrobica TaxID=455193 RepID=A0A1I4QCU1_9PSEU|nr:hypothetical protein [Saccharopolyspora antimicrobica]RKT84867.1 hypothetical protein ATL45_3198 [Saccharopolyspora antimicrobica]SFM37616.1 hypothetical protein SAMN05421805_10160 [Saccharopolyspora antimicrobica]
MHEEPTASAEELAFCEAELPEWERLSVRDYWDAVIAEELGAQVWPASPYAWSDLGPSEQTRLRRQQRRTNNAGLRLITVVTDRTPSDMAPNLGEAA